MFHPKGPSFLELARQALSSTERGYDLLAPKFDYTPFRTPQWLLDAVAKPLREMGPFRSGLDLCFLPSCMLNLLCGRSEEGGGCDVMPCGVGWCGVCV